MKIDNNETLKKIQSELEELSGSLILQPTVDKMLTQIRHSIVGIFIEYCGNDILEHILIDVKCDDNNPYDVNVTFVPLTGEGLELLERLEEMSYDSDEWE